MTYDHLKVLLDDEALLGVAGDAAQDVARTAVPPQIQNALVLSTMVGLRKSDGGMRGIATGATFRRLVGRALAKQVGPAIEAACSPHQYALSTRAGTDCVGHVIRALTDADTSATLLSIDGVGAYDHVLRAAVLGGHWGRLGARVISYPLSSCVRATVAVRMAR